MFEQIFRQYWRRRAQLQLSGANDAISVNEQLQHISPTAKSSCADAWLNIVASPVGLIVESFTDAERDPLQAELFENPSVIENGAMRLNKAPGLGLELRYDTPEKYGKRIL